MSNYAGNVAVSLFLAGFLALPLDLRERDMRAELQVLTKLSNALCVLEPQPGNIGHLQQWRKESRRIPWSESRLAGGKAEVARQLVTACHQVIAANQAARDLHDGAMALLFSCSAVAPNQSWGLYECVLAMLESDPSSTILPVTVLSLGRWACAKARPDNAVTIYDAQMLQNHITVRRRPVVPP